MAEWSVGVNDAVAVKRFSRRLFKQVITKTIAYRLAQISSSIESEENIVQILDDTMKGPGDKITYDLIAKLAGPGVAGDNTLAGSEEALTPYTASIIIDQLRHAVLVRGAMSQQRVPFSMRDVARVRLADWWLERMNISVINQATGNTNQADTKFTGMQGAVAPTAANQVFGRDANGAATHTTEATLAAGDSFKLSAITDAVLLAHTAVYPIKPIMLKAMSINGVALIHPKQTQSLRLNYTAGNWGDIQKAAMTGGQVSGNPIFTGAIGMAEGVVIHEDAAVPYGDGTEASSRNALGQARVARGVFMGAQSLAMAFGRAYATQTTIKWFEELLDAGNQLRISAGKIFGILKNVFNGVDYATITLSSYE